MAPIFTVMGATGAQGSSVVDHALKAGVYKVRAVTRNPNSEKAKALAAKGAEVVQADVNDEESLVKAFHVSCRSYLQFRKIHLTYTNRAQRQSMVSPIFSSHSQKVVPRKPRG
jgi:uncharacterized protein YbjT (DUF2867 family)